MLPRPIAAVPVMLLLFGSQQELLAAIPPAVFSAPVQILDGSFIKQWLVLGAFDSEGLSLGLLVDQGGAFIRAENFADSEPLHTTTDRV